MVTTSTAKRVQPHWSDGMLIGISGDAEAFSSGVSALESDALDMGVSVDAVNVLVASPPPFGVSEGSCSWVAVAAPMGVWEIVGE